MTTKHLVDPEIVPMLDMFPELNFTAESLSQTRAFFNEMNAQLLAGLPEFPDVTVSEQRIAGPQGAPDVRVLVYRPKNVSTPVPALLWIHGGGYVIGNADQADPHSNLLFRPLVVRRYQWTTGLPPRHRIPVRSRTAMPL